MTVKMNKHDDGSSRVIKIVLRAAPDSVLLMALAATAILLTEGIFAFLLSGGYGSEPKLSILQTKHLAGPFDDFMILHAHRKTRNQSKRFHTPSIS